MYLLPTTKVAYTLIEHSRTSPKHAEKGKERKAILRHVVGLLPILIAVMGTARYVIRMALSCVQSRICHFGFAACSESHKLITHF